MEHLVSQDSQDHLVQTSREEEELDASNEDMFVGAVPYADSRQVFNIVQHYLRLNYRPPATLAR